MQFHIKTMTCGGCVRGVTQAIRSVDPTAEVIADPPSRQVRVKSAAAPEKIEAALQAAGFPPVRSE